MVKYGDWINESVKMFSAQWAQWIGAAGILLLFQLPLMSIFFLLNFFPIIANGELDISKLESIPAWVIPVICALSVVGLVMLVFVPPLMAGMYICAFNQMRTGRFAASDVFKGLRYFWQTNLYFGIIGLLIVIGYCFCIVPGAYLAVCGFFAIPLIAEKQLGFSAAFSASRDMVSRDFWNFLLFAIIASILSGLGANICYIGLLVTMPFYYLTHAVAYRDAFGVQGVETPDSAGLPPAGSDGFLFCPKCGAGVVPGGRFCTNCGQMFVKPDPPAHGGAPDA